jgi:hypothetical protein
MIRQLFSTLAIFAIGVTLGVGNAGAQTICDGRLPAGTYASVPVPEGKSCLVAPPPGSVVTVTGNVTVAQGARFVVGFVGEFIVNGNLKGADASAISLATGVPPSRIEIDVNVTLTGTTDTVFIESSNVFIGGNLQSLTPLVRQSMWKVLM